MKILADICWLSICADSDVMQRSHYDPIIANYILPQSAAFVCQETLTSRTPAPAAQGLDADLRRQRNQVTTHFPAGLDVS